MSPLTDDEAALLYHIQTWGSDGYPISKLGTRHWIIGPWRSWTGFPVCYKTRAAAVKQFESWVTLALERWREMKAGNPDLIMTGVGVRGQLT